MAQGYIRNDTSNNIADASIIDAVDLDGEFDAIAAAFVAVTGHAHDGTAANGATIGVLGPNQDVVVTSATLRPKTDNTVDLGTSSLEFKDLYIDGVANIDSLIADTADINAGTIDGVTIATSDITVGSGKTLNVSAGTLTLADNQISGDKVEGGTINAITVNTLASTTVNTTNVNTTNLSVAGTTLTATAAELNVLDGITATVAELNILDGVTASTAELNILDGVTASTAELNYVDGVTSNIQTQLDSKVTSVSTAFTGTPTAPTAAVNTNTTQIATTAFVVAQIADDAPTKTGGGASGTGWGISITGSSGSTTGNAATATNLTGMTTTVEELNLLDGITANVRQLNSSSEDVNSENRIINGDFGIWQRGTSFSTYAYGADRWINQFVGGTGTQSQQLFALGDTLGTTQPVSFLRQTVSGQTLPSHLSVLQQPIDGVRSYAGQTITVLGWVRRASGTGNVAIAAVQSFGTGGTPSTANTGISPQTVTLTTSFAPFAAVLVVPTISGKTLGTNGNDYLGINFWLSAGTDFNISSNGIGLQTIGVDFWGIHIRQGTWTAADANLYRPRDTGTELAMCQRFYQDLGTISVREYTTTSQQFGTMVTYPVTMRRVPTGALANTVTSNATGSFFALLGTTSLNYAAVTTTTGVVLTSSTVTLDAEIY
jgi:hypothetical protein